MSQKDSKIVARRILVTLGPTRSAQVAEQAEKPVPGTMTDGQSGLTGLVGQTLGIGLGMMYSIGGLGVGTALRVTEAAGLNTCMMTSGIFNDHQPGGRKARGDRCRGATGSEVMLGGSRKPMLGAYCKWGVLCAW